MTIRQEHREVAAKLASAIWEYQEAIGGPGSDWDTDVAKMIESALTAVAEVARERERADCAALIEGNHLLSGSIGPLMDHGWALANKAGAAAIRARRP